MSLEQGCRARLLQSEDGRQAVALLDHWEGQLAKLPAAVEEIEKLLLLFQQSSAAQWAALRDIVGLQGWEIHVAPVDCFNLQRGWKAVIQGPPLLSTGGLRQVNAAAPTFDELLRQLLDGWRRDFFQQGGEAMT